ncbi:O-antigen ligase family protein [Candidatus Roizmanbacteria bacterium]|nr:O-antigen ligase family protein [Candidatus Roizmanbacteria bacterium]
MLKLTKCIQWCFYALFFLTPLVMYPRTSELFEFNKMIVIYLLALFILGAWSVELIGKRSKLIWNVFLTIPFTLFLASQTISTILSIDVHTSLFGYYGRFNGGLLSIITYLFLFYAYINNFSWENTKKALKWSLFSALLTILWALPGKFGHDMSCLIFSGDFSNSCWTDQFRPAERMFSTLGQPNWMGAYLAIQFFILLGFLLKSPFPKKDRKQIGKTVALYAFAALMFGAILFTRSRSAFGSVGIGLVLVPFALTAVFFNKKEYLLLYLKRFAILLVVLLLPLFYAKTGVNEIDKLLRFELQKPTSVVQKQISQKAAPAVIPIPESGVTESFDIRKIVWKGAEELGHQYPIFGTGVETFAYSYYFVRPVEHNLTSEWDYLYNKAHNEFLNFLATTGYTGLTLYSVVIGATFLLFIQFLAKKNILLPQGRQAKNIKVDNILQEEQETKLMIMSFVFAYLTIHITNFFGFSTTTVNIFFYLLPAMALTALPKSATETIQKRVITQGQKVGMGAVGIAICFGVFYIFQYWSADIHYAMSDNYVKVGEYQKAGVELQEALKEHYEHAYEDKLSYILANLAYIASTSKQSEIANQLVTLSDMYNIHSLQESPQNVLYWKTKAKNDYLFYQITVNSKYLQQGLEALQAAKKLSPTDPKISYTYALYLSLMFDEEKDAKAKLTYQQASLQEIDRCIKLKVNYRDAYILKGQLQKKYGLKAEAKKTFEYIISAVAVNDPEAKKELEGL